MPKCVRCGKVDDLFKCRKNWLFAMIIRGGPRSGIVMEYGPYSESKGSEVYISIVDNVETGTSLFAGLCPDCQLPEKEEFEWKTEHVDPKTWYKSTEKKEDPHVPTRVNPPEKKEVCKWCGGEREIKGLDGVTRWCSDCGATGWVNKRRRDPIAQEDFALALDILDGMINRLTERVDCLDNKQRAQVERIDKMEKHQHFVTTITSQAKGRP